MKSLAEFVRETPFFAIAHRGSSGEAPENTMAALQRALVSGAPMVELDVQRTADNTLVVFHDDVLGRTTNGHGYIRQTTTDELMKLDAGSWFSDAFAGERVPTITQALELLAGRVYVNIELKPFDDEDASTTDDVHRLVELVHRFTMAHTVAFSSFDHRTLALVKHLDNRLPTVALQVPGDVRSPAEVVVACGANAWGCSVEELTTDWAANARIHGIPYGVYTVNTQQQLEAMIALGVRAVVTNYPHQIMDFTNRT
jgi:glycerophosphoryl diester phosphodiesterase